MKLLLTSIDIPNQQIADAFLAALSQTPGETVALIISHMPSSIQASYTQGTKDKLSSLGVKDITIFDLESGPFKPDHDYDLIWVCGGNTFNYLELMRKTGVDQYIMGRVRAGHCLYVGTSAGAILAGPSIEIAGWGSEGDSNEIGLEDLSALSLTNTAIFPHYHDELAAEVEAMKKRVNYPIITLTNDEALLIDDNQQTKI